MKLLFDENLPPRLTQSLADLYPGSTHLRDSGLRGVSDGEVWLYAKENSFTTFPKILIFGKEVYYLAARLK